MASILVPWVLYVPCLFRQCVWRFSHGESARFAIRNLLYVNDKPLCSACDAARNPGPLYRQVTAAKAEFGSTVEAVRRTQQQGDSSRALTAYPIPIRWASWRVLGHDSGIVQQVPCGVDRIHRSDQEAVSHAPCDILPNSADPWISLTVRRFSRTINEARWRISESEQSVRQR
jgi:hypothetical protein